MLLSKEFIYEFCNFVSQIRHSYMFVFYETFTEMGFPLNCVL